MTIQTPIAPQTLSEKKVVLNNISWETFNALLTDMGENRACRIAYDQGVLEIRMPLRKHEEPKELIGDFVKAIADELEIEISSLGALTLTREDLKRAIEPDTCFYIQNEPLIRGKENIELSNDPPPDLVLESDYKNSSLNKFTIYSSLGVPELWRYREQTLQIYQLVELDYQLTDKSLAFPFLPVAEVPGFIEQSKTIGQRAAVRLFRQRIKNLVNSH